MVNAHQGSLMLLTSDITAFFITPHINRIKLYCEVKNKIIFFSNFRQKVNVGGQFGEVEKLSKLLGDKKDGFFIEAGAYDGELISNTLHFEAYRVIK